METVLVTLAVLACPIGMVLMMLFMGGGLMRRRERDKDARTSAVSEPESLEVLQAEKKALDERIAALEDERPGR